MILTFESPSQAHAFKYSVDNDISVFVTSTMALNALSDSFKIHPGSTIDAFKCRKKSKKKKKNF